MGRIGTFQGTSKLGTTTFDPPPGLQALLQNDLNSTLRVSPLASRARPDLLPSLSQRLCVRQAQHSQVSAGEDALRAARLARHGQVGDEGC